MVLREQEQDRELCSRWSLSWAAPRPWASLKKARPWSLSLAREACLFMWGAGTDPVTNLLACTKGSPSKGSWEFTGCFCSGRKVEGKHVSRALWSSRTGHLGCFYKSQSVQATTSQEKPRIKALIRAPDGPLETGTNEQLEAGTKGKDRHMLFICLF